MGGLLFCNCLGARGESERLLNLPFKVMAMIICLLVVLGGQKRSIRKLIGSKLF